MPHQKSMSNSDVNNGLSTQDALPTESTQPEDLSTTPAMVSSDQQTQPVKRENMLVNIIFNIALPAIILSRLSGEEHLGPTWALVVALAFPIGYGIKDYFRAGKINFFSGLGVMSVLLTGGISLLELDPKYIAYKEAGSPLLIGLAVIGSLKTRWPLVRTFLYSDLILNTASIDKALGTHKTESQFNQTLINASWMLAGSFFLSAALNYILARVILTETPGTEAFNAQLGTMTWVSYLVIALPSFIILAAIFFYLIRQIKKLTQLQFEDIIISPDD